MQPTFQPYLYLFLRNSNSCRYGMSAVLQQQPTSSWGFATFNRMSSVEELDSSLTLLSRHAVLASTRAMVTPPGSPSSSSSSSVSRSPLASTSSVNSGATTSGSVDSTGRQTFDDILESPDVKISPNTTTTPIHPLAIGAIQRR